ncbi:hypothetical protein ACJW30_06G127000 [Castanea mollissima]
MKREARVSAWYKEVVRASTIEVLAYEEDKVAFNRIMEAMGVDWVKNEFHSFVIQMNSNVEAARVATPLTNEVVGVKNEGAKEEMEEELRYEAVAEEKVRKEVDSEMAKPEADSEEVEPEAITEEVEANYEATAVSALLLLLPARRSRRTASILAEQKIDSIYKMEDDEDNEDED